MDLNRKLLSDIVVWGKYARHLPSVNRRETWEEIVIRSAEMHIKKFPELEDDIWEAFSHVLNKEIVPSMRSLQFGGKPIELSNNRMFNCAFMQARHYKAFNETMFLLLGGSGVGYSVQKRHVNQLPNIRPPRGSVRYVIQDSITGWSEAVKFLMKSYFFGKPKPIFIYDDIRPKGTQLVTAGGQAPGPEPLKKGLDAIENILKTKKYGDKLKPIEVFDIICYIADAVLSGGIRRSATICLFDFDDNEMLTAKSGDWWIDNPQRALANISVVLDRRKLKEEDFNKVFDITRYSGSGEPGFVLTNDPDMGFNPCSEVSLTDCSGCNLSEVNVSTITDQKMLNELAGWAAFIGTLQASYTDFWYLRPEWKKTMDDDALLGVSLTGLASLDPSLDLEEAMRYAKWINDNLSRKIKINPAKRIGCVKPSGTTSLVLGTSAGIHSWYAPYYIRRMTLNKDEPLYKYLEQKVPELLEPHYQNLNDVVLNIPIKAPEGSVFRSESALNLLERVAYVTHNWIVPGHISGLNKHNVSVTVNVKEDEWEDVKEWMYANRDSYSGMALLPHDSGLYKQAPFEEINEATYEALSKYLTEIDLTAIQEAQDETDLTGEIACGGNGCTVTSV